MRFDDQVAVLTGAGGGLGKQYALLLASRGARVVVNDTGGSVTGAGGNTDAATTAAEEIRRHGGEAIPDTHSVASPEGGQAIIDMALEMVEKMPKKAGKVDWSQIKNITLVTSHHTDHVIGTGANDPQKIDPNSPRGTLDHSIMFIFAAALHGGARQITAGVFPGSPRRARAVTSAWQWPRC